MVLQDIGADLSIKIISSGNNVIRINRLNDFYENLKIDRIRIIEIKNKKI